MKVCEKVKKKGTTSYNEVADELVKEFTNPANMASLSDQVVNNLRDSIGKNYNNRSSFSSTIRRTSEDAFTTP